MRGTKLASAMPAADAVVADVAVAARKTADASAKAATVRGFGMAAP